MDQKEEKVKLLEKQIQYETKMYADYYTKKDQELEASEKLIVGKMKKFKEQTVAKMEVIEKEREEMDRINKELFKKVEERDQELKARREELETLRKAKTNDAAQTLGSGKLNEMESQIAALKQREAALEELNAQLQAKCSMLQDQSEGAEQAQRTLQRQNSQLLMSKNPQAKTQYLDKQKAEMNNLKKENQQF